MNHIIKTWIALFITPVTLGASTTASSYSIDTTSSPSVLTGLWWNANESGWGLTVTQQYGVIFVAMDTYDTANNPIWYVITNCPVVNAGCTGDIFKVKGGSPLTIVWQPNLALTKVGVGSLTFADSNNANMSFTIDGVTGSKTITRQVFASTPPVTTSTFPINFNGYILNSITLNFDGRDCIATLSVTNGTQHFGAFIAFDVIATNGLPMLFASDARPGKTGIGTYTVGILDNQRTPSCSGFTLRFNPSGSSFIG